MYIDLNAELWCKCKHFIATQQSMNIHSFHYKRRECLLYIYIWEIRAPSCSIQLKEVEVYGESKQMREPEGEEAYIVSKRPSHFVRFVSARAAHNCIVLNINISFIYLMCIVLGFASSPKKKKNAINLCNFVARSKIHLNKIWPSFCVRDFEEARRVTMDEILHVEYMPEKLYAIVHTHQSLATLFQTAWEMR